MRCGNRNVYFIKEEEDGTLGSGSIISDGSLEIINFAEDNNVSHGEGLHVYPPGVFAGRVSFLFFHVTLFSSLSPINALPVHFFSHGQWWLGGFVP